MRCTAFILCNRLIQVKLDLENGEKNENLGFGVKLNWEMAKITWENLGSAPSVGVDTLECTSNKIII